MKLKATNITKSYNNCNVIQNVNINLDEGEIVSLLGVSGVGKTTVFNILSGLVKPDVGKVFLKDKDITGIPGNVSYMLQKDQLFEFKTIIDNISLPLIIKGIRKEEARSIARSYLDKFGLENCEKSYPKQLSGGMRQRAAFLRTYLFSSEVALLDEPFSALDPFTKYNMYRWYLDIIKDIRLSTMFISHDIDEAILLSNRIYIMAGNPGEIVAEIKIINKPDDIIKFTLEEKFIKYKKQIIEAMNGY